MLFFAPSIPGIPGIHRKFPRWSWCRALRIERSAGFPQRWARMVAPVRVVANPANHWEIPGDIFRCSPWMSVAYSSRPQIAHGNHPGSFVVLFHQQTGFWKPAQLRGLMGIWLILVSTANRLFLDIYSIQQTDNFRYANDLIHNRYIHMLDI